MDFNELTSILYVHKDAICATGTTNPWEIPNKLPIDNIVS